MFSKTLETGITFLSKNLIYISILLNVSMIVVWSKLRVSEKCCLWTRI